MIIFINDIVYLFQNVDGNVEYELHFGFNFASSRILSEYYFAQEGIASGVKGFVPMVLNSVCLKVFNTLSPSQAYKENLFRRQKPVMPKVPKE
jgi:hypothetical protein